MKVFLDDIRDPPDDSWTVVRSYNQMINVLNADFVFSNITEISLDHDLGENKSGYDVL
jgi:hypothetical protein